MINSRKESLKTGLKDSSWESLKTGLKDSSGDSLKTGLKDSSGYSVKMELKDSSGDSMKITSKNSSEESVDDLPKKVKNKGLIDEMFKKSAAERDEIIDVSEDDKEIGTDSSTESESELFSKEMINRKRVIPSDQEIDERKQKLQE